jgi:hypothetical protein
MNVESMISLCSLYKLIIFSLVLVPMGCQQQKSTTSNKITIVWKDGRAIGLSVPKTILKNATEDSLPLQFQVRLAKSGKQPAVAGEYRISQHEIIFEPFIPLTRGLSYEILVKHQSPVVVEIPKASEVPKLIAIYPSQDTLPENLLKVYFVFSRPMLKGHSLQYVKLADRKGDSLPNIFLNLQQELWNDKGTVLTLWLDPGRIKRHLQPNQLLGPPLSEGETYSLTISSEWPDEQGASLTSTYTKNIVIISRDTAIPTPDNWKLKLPTAGTVQALELDLREPHDYFLLQNTIRLIDPGGSVVNGTNLITDAERKYSFVPAKPWSPGKYKLQIEPQLEDLAGNNLDRLFDRDLRTSEKNQPAKKVYEREWLIAH